MSAFGMKVIFSIAKTWIGVCVSGLTNGRLCSYPMQLSTMFGVVVVVVGLSLLNGINTEVCFVSTGSFLKRAIPRYCGFLWY